MPIDAQDPYFLSEEKLPNGEFKGFKKYGTFIPSEIIGPFIADAINQRDSALVSTFENTISNLLDKFIQNPPAYKDFLSLMDDVRIDGLVLMALRRRPFMEYHTPEHAQELVYDITHELTRIYNKQTPSPSIANSFFLELAKVASAWHDVVQDLGPPGNEAVSAEKLVEELRNKLIEFSVAHSKMKNEIEQFIHQLKFICVELIVNATWLVMDIDPKKGVIRKPFYQYVLLALKDFNEMNEKAGLPIIKFGTGPHLERLFLAGETIALADTSRFLLDHVLKSQMSLKCFNELSEKLRKPLEDFFLLYNISTDEEKEIFLGLECQDLRMFPELNIPYDEDIHSMDSPLVNVADLSQKDLQAFIEACDVNRKSKHLEHKINYAHLLDLFINTTNKKKNKSLEKRNIHREQAFAKSLQKETWDHHARALTDFDNYVSQLSEESRNALGEALLALSTRYQPGFMFLQQDEKYQQKLKEVKAMTSKS